MTGSTPPTADSSNYGDEYLFVSPADLGESKRIERTAKRLSGKGFSISRRFPKDSVLFVCIGSTIGKCGMAVEDLTANQQINAVLPSEHLNSDFLYYSLLRAAHRVRASAAEQAVPLVNKTQFANTRIALPPTKFEQAAIAAVLSDVDTLLDGLTRLIAKKHDVKQATMQQLLTGRTRLPSFRGNWTATQLGQLGSFLKGSGIKKDQAKGGTLPCVRYGELYTDHHDVIREFRSWIAPSVASQATRLRRGDLLFAGSGETKEEIGKCAAFVSDVEAYAAGDIVILRPDNVDSIFMGYFLNVPIVAAQKASRGQGDAVVHISASALASIRLALPPVEEQTAIATILSDMDAELVALEARRAKTQALKQAIMQALLTGRIRLVSPEPAHA
jgi:type I restriction enzyme S subunit